jgi:hypothetical protein
VLATDTKVSSALKLVTLPLPRAPHMGASAIAMGCELDRSVPHPSDRLPFSAFATCTGHSLLYLAALALACRPLQSCIDCVDGFHWHIGTLTKFHIGTLTNFTLAHWHIFTLAHWHIGTLAHGHIDTLPHRRVDVQTRSQSDSDSDRRTSVARTIVMQLVDCCWRRTRAVTLCHSSNG